MNKEQTKRKYSLTAFFISNVVAYPFLRAATSFQTLHTYKDATHFSLRESIKSQDIRGAYKGFSPFFLRVFLSANPLFAFMAYPLELLQIRACAAGSNYQVNFAELKNAAGKASWVGFAGYAVATLFSYDPLLLLFVVPLDNIRRNFVVQSLDSSLEKPTYTSVFNSLKAKGVPGLYAGVSYYAAMIPLLLILNKNY